MENEILLSSLQYLNVCKEQVLIPVEKCLLVSEPQVFSLIRRDIKSTVLSRVLKIKM